MNNKLFKGGRARFTDQPAILTSKSRLKQRWNMSNFTLARVVFMTVSSAGLALFLFNQFVVTLETQTPNSLFGAFLNSGFPRLAIVFLGLAGGLYASFHLYSSAVKNRP